MTAVFFGDIMARQPAKRKVGRPLGSVKIPDVQAELCKLISIGTPIMMACDGVGISYPAYNKWMHKGEDAVSGQYRDFYKAIKKAEADMVARSVARIQKAAQDGTWQADAWLLERRCPQEFGRDRDVSSVNIVNVQNQQTVVTESVKERIKKYDELFEKE